MNAAGSDFFVLTDPLLLEEQIQLLFPRHRGALTFGNTLASLINASKELLLADKAVIFSYWHNLEVACAGGQDYALPTGGQSKILALICSEIAETVTLSVRWEMDGRKSDQMRPNLRDTKKQDFVKCLKINNLQSLVVPRTGLEPVQPLRAKGFSYCYDFRHRLCRL